MNQINYGIYRWTNQINGKVYIGLSVNPEGRKYSHIQATKRGSTFPLHLALMKYGVENFTFEVIFTVFNKDDLGEFEHHFIKEHNCCRLDGDVQGYNLTRGGEGFDSETARNLINRRTKEGTNPWAGEMGSKHSTDLAKRLKAEGRHCSQDPLWIKARGDEVRSRVQDGTHHWLGDEWSEKVSAKNQEKVKAGTHQWQSDENKKRVKEMIESGTHYFGKTGICDHCGKECSLANLKKWHNANCLKNPNVDFASRKAETEKSRSAKILKKAINPKPPKPPAACPHCGTIASRYILSHHHYDKCIQK